MKYNLDQQAEQFKRGYIKKRRWHKLVAILACVTVFVTVYALVMPATTMTGDVAAGKVGPSFESETVSLETGSNYSNQGASIMYEDKNTYSKTDSVQSQTEQDPQQVVLTAEAEEDSGVSVTVSGELNSKTTLQVTKMSDFNLPEEYLSEKTELVGMYDISLYLNSEEVQPENSVTVSIGGIENLNGYDIKVYHISDDGEIKEVSASVAASGTILFQTEGFSGFAIAKSPQSGAEGTAYYISSSGVDYNLKSTITVNNKTLSSQMTLNSGDEFSLTVSWNLPSAGSYTENDTFVYELEDDIFALNDFTGKLYNSDGTIEYGTYTISGRQITVRYNNEFFDLNNKYSSITANGKIIIDETTVISQEGYTINVPGLESVVVRLRTNTGMTIKKESEKRTVEGEDGTREAWVDYTITLTSNGYNENVKLTDNFYIDEANPHKIGTTVPSATLNGEPYALTTDKGDATSTGAVQSSTPARVTTASISEMNVGDELIIKYSAKLTFEPNAVSQSYYGDVKIHNIVTAESDQCSPISDRRDDSFSITYIDKDGGNLDGNLTMTYWRIYVCGGEYKTLTVQDILPKNCHIYPTDDTEVSVYSASGRSASGAQYLCSISFAQLKAGYKVTFPESGWVMFYYECEADDDCTVKNAAKIIETNKNADYSFSHGTVSATYGTKEWVSAGEIPGTSFGENYFDSRILNEINISVGTASVDLGSDFYFVDQTKDQNGNSVHHFPGNVSETIVSIEVEDSNNPGTYIDAKDRFDVTLKKEVTKSGSNYDSMYFYFVDSDNDGNSDVIPGNYKIRYYTIVEHEKCYERSEYCQISNYLYWSNGSSSLSGGGTKQRWRAYTCLWKETKSAVKIKNDEIVWKIGNLGITYRLYDLDTQKDMRSESTIFRKYSTVVDTLPAGVEFVAAAYGNENLVAGGEDNVAPTKITYNADGTTTLEFPICKDPNAVQDLYILTKYSDYNALTEAVGITNSVQISLKTEENGPAYEPKRLKITAKATLQPPVVANKSVEYNSNTAPYAEYTIIINSAASDLITNEDAPQTFELHDNMGSALAIDASTLLINGKDISSYPKLKLATTGGGQSFILSGLEDETAYTITYKALVLLKAGEQFTNENAKNEIEIPGIEITKPSVMETYISGAVYGSSGTAGGEYGLVRVSKVDDRTAPQPVEGAVFTVYKIGTMDEVASLSVLPEDGTVVGTLTTGQDGFTAFQQVDFGVIYAIKETAVPSGYLSSGEITYFGYRSWEMDKNGASFPSVVQDLTDNLAHTFNFINQASVEITITKIVDGSSTNSEAFPFTLTSTTEMKPGEGYELSEENKKATFNLKNGESVTLTVYTGSEITLTENKHNGYVVTIKEGDELLKNGDSATFSVDEVVKRNITVYNTPGVVLPETGGMGTHWITFAGVLCLASAFVYGYVNRRRQGRRFN